MYLSANFIRFLMQVTFKPLLRRSLFAGLLLTGLFAANHAGAQDYTITTTATSITVNDAGNNSDGITLSEGVGGTFRVEVPMRTYSLNGGPVLAFPVNLSLAGITSITVNANGGNDFITLNGFTVILPSLTLNGGPGNDVVTISGAVNFANNSNLDIDLQNDAASPGEDRIQFGVGALLTLSGTGSAVVKVSRNVFIDRQGGIMVANGPLTVEANQQATPTTGSFKGIQLSGGILKSTGTGALTVKGKGGNSGDLQTGIELTMAAEIQSGTTTGLLDGRGGNSPGASNHGVFLSVGENRIHALQGQLTVEGRGGGTGASGTNYGVHIGVPGSITGGTSGKLTVTGYGGNPNSTDGSNHGIYMVGETGGRLVNSLGAHVDLTGEAGGHATHAYNYGIFLLAQSEVWAGGMGNLTIMAQGKNGSGLWANSDAAIRTEGGHIAIEGRGHGKGPNINIPHVGVALSLARVEAGGSGQVSIAGWGAVENATNDRNMGVYCAACTVSSSGGPVSVTGTGGGQPEAKENYGVMVMGTDKGISAGGNGKVTVTGTGGETAGNNNYGVLIQEGGKISSSGGDVEVNGTGKVLNTGGFAYGVFLETNGQIKAEGNGHVMVHGKGGISRGFHHYGVCLDNEGIISTVHGNITVEGEGGGEGLSAANSGILMRENCIITSTGTGNIFLKGTGGAGEGDLGQNQGIELYSGPLISTSNGNIMLEGTGGGINAGGEASAGIYGFNTKILAGGNGKIKFTGQGGHGTGSFIHGVRMLSNFGLQTNNGDVEITGTGGGMGTNTTGAGVEIFLSAKVKAGGNGKVAIHGIGGKNALGNLNFGVLLGSSTDHTQIETEGGDVTITGEEGLGSNAFGISHFGGFKSGIISTQSHGGDISLIANSIRFETYQLKTQPGGKITIKPYTSGVTIDLGLNADAVGGPLALADGELDNFSTGTLLIGDATAGAINISADITRPASTHMQLISGGDISISTGLMHTAGGNLLLKPGPAPAAVRPTKAGTDVAVGTLSFGSDLAIDIFGPAVDIGYNQLNVTGIVNLTGVNLKLGGNHVPANGNQFIIVNNDGNDPIIGTFTGLPQGASIPNFLGSGYPATITYTGGDGNDAVIFVASIPESKNLCPGGSTTLPSIIPGSSYQWQRLEGADWVNLQNGANILGVNSSNLQLLNMPTSFYGMQLRCVVNGDQFSPVYLIKFVTTWTGALNNLWGTAANWSCGAVPDKFVDVIIPAGLDVYPVVNIAEAEARNVDLKTGAQLLIPAANKLSVGMQ